MNVNSFKLEEQNKEKYYKARDKIVGYRYLNYNLSGSTLIISAWLKDLQQKLALNKRNNQYKYVYNELHKLIKQSIYSLF